MPLTSSESTAEVSSPSLLNLRQFRFQKKSVPKLGCSETSNHGPNISSLPLTPEREGVIGRVRKPRAPRLLDSDSEDDKGCIKPDEMSTPSSDLQTTDHDTSCIDLEDDLETKEMNLKFLQDALPSLDKMVLQDALVSCDWSVEQAMSLLIGDENSKLTNGEPDKRSTSDDEITIPAKRVRRQLISSEEQDDDLDKDENPYENENMFDSDDSDQEIEEDVRTESRNQVLHFLSTATMSELRLMPNCSSKKAEAILQARPFTSWEDLDEKLRNRKHLGTVGDLFHSVRELLRMRQGIESLMTRCMKVATQMEQAVAAGASSVKEQPRILSSGLQLASYQLVGLNWLLVMHNQGLNGILADEMGLGKTVQVIAFLAHLYETGTKGPHLVVVPSSTLANWSNEFARWCPTLRVTIYYGSQEERKLMRYQFVKEGLDDIDIVLTTYSIVNNLPEEKKMFRLLEMNYVVLDEAHMLKNMATQRYDNLVRINAKHRILLTGTPLQNNLLELMSLLIFVMPDLFACRRDDLKKLFSKTPRQGSERTDDMPQFEREQVQNARRIMKPFVLRRLKSQVLKDLPCKTEIVLHCDMELKQQERYSELVSMFSEKTKDTQLDNEEEFCQEVESTGKMSGLAMLMELRKAANHSALLRYHFTYDMLTEMAPRLAADPAYKEKDVEFITEKLYYMSDFELHQLARNYKSLSGYYLPEEVILTSGKFRELDRLLPDLQRKGHRVLIFSQFVLMLDILEEYMKLKGYKFLRLDGSVAVTTRQELIDEYNQDPSILVFLLSTKAGGLGINLTSADTVIIHDIDYNPHNDKQAEDRCHRVGQTSDVTVMRMISKGTIEEAIYEVAQEKLKLERDLSNVDDENEKSEAKNVVSLLKQALGLDPNKSLSQIKVT